MNRGEYMDESQDKILEAIWVSLIELRKGKFKEFIQPAYESEPLSEIFAELNKLSGNMRELYEYVVPLSKGDLDIERPSRTNFLAASLKELHSRLIHLTWQAQQIENGDYNQRVDFMGEFSNAFNSMIQRLDDRESQLKQEIAVRKKAELELQEKNTLITESIEYALMIQKSILPPSALFEKYVSDFSAVWLPKDIVGGDSYWFFPLKQGFLAAVVDCTGHGVPGAFLTIAVTEILNGIVNEDYDASPASILNQLHSRINSCFYKGDTSDHYYAGLDISLCKVDFNRRNITFSGARLPLFHLREGNITELTYLKRSIGYNSRSRSNKMKPVEFFDTDLPYLPGDTIYMSSDGLWDQDGEHDPNGFGSKRMTEILAKNSGLGLEEQKNRLVDEFTAYRGSQDQRDDVTLIGLKLR
jgi:serine phosphatase RsbU (regulator of sigma subunit)